MSKNISNSTAPQVLSEAARLVREDFRRRAAHLNLTQPQWRTLLILSREPGINQAALAEKLEVHPVTVTQSVDRLVKAGWVRRERQETDRRAQRLFLNERAEPILEELNHIAGQTRQIAMAGFSAAECVQLETMLMRVKQNLCATVSNSDCNE